MDIAIIAGEASGDNLGFGLIQSFSNNSSLCHPSFSGICGPKMISAGAHSFYDMERLAVMGIIEPLKRLPELLRIHKHMYQHFIQQKPDVFIGIDAPDFNLRLEEKFRLKGIPTVHYVSPSVWAWRKKRIHKIKKAVDLMLTLFPFELKIYQEHDIPAVCVGHPLADTIPLQIDKSAARKKLNLDENAHYIALFPGSRKQEIAMMGEVFLETAKQCIAEDPGLKFIASFSSQDRLNEFKSLVEAKNISVELFLDKSYDVIAASDFVLTKSGTITLETMFFKKPMVIAHKMANVSYQILKRLIQIPYVGLPNLLANEMIVPEFIQEDATPFNLKNAILKGINNSHVEKLKNKFYDIHLLLKKNASNTAMRAILDMLETK